MTKRNAPDKALFFNRKIIFFFIIKNIIILLAHYSIKESRQDAILMSTKNICFSGETKNTSYLNTLLIWRYGNIVCMFRQKKAHYENTPIHISRRITSKKLKIPRLKTDIFHISAQNLDCGYLLEPPRRGGSNEYPLSMCLSKKKKKKRKIMYTPVNPSFTV